MFAGVHVAARRHRRIHSGWCKCAPSGRRVHSNLCVFPRAYPVVVGFIRIRVGSLQRA